MAPIPKTTGPRVAPQPPPLPPQGQPQPKPVKPAVVQPKDTFEDRELQAMQKKAEKTYASLIAQGAKIVVSRSAGNSNKPIVTVIPPALANNTDPKLKYDVQVHYHGMHGTVVSPNGASKVKEQIEASFKRSPPTVFVLPETDNVPMQGSIGPLWANSVKDTGVTADDGVKGLTGTRAQLTVSAHSLGRDALHVAAKNGGLKADRVDIQDGFSGNRTDQISDLYDWMKKNPRVSVRISTGMMSEEGIRKHAPKLSPMVFFKDFSKDHWGAELQPWS